MQVISTSDIAAEKNWSDNGISRHSNINTSMGTKSSPERNRTSFVWTPEDPSLPSASMNAARLPVRSGASDRFE